MRELARCFPSLHANLFGRMSSHLLPHSLQMPNTPRVVKTKRTHLPLRELEVHLATALGNESLILLQAPAHDASSDGEVAVVAVFSKRHRVSSICPQCVSGSIGPVAAARFSFSSQPGAVVANSECGKNSSTGGKGQLTHVRPADFQANVILEGIARW